MHVAIGTPMYGGQCFGEFASSVMDLQEGLLASGGRLTRIFQGNESLVTRGRDTIAHLFLHKTDASHLLFADADLHFRASDVARMMKVNRPLVCGPVAMKGINWPAVAAAAATESVASELASHGAIWSVKAVPGAVPDAAGLLDVEHAGGFVLIRRDVFETLAPTTPVYRGHGAVAGQAVRHFFATEIRNGELLSEDYAFCRRWRDTGGAVALATWCKIRHYGTHAFGGT